MAEDGGLSSSHFYLCMHSGRAKRECYNLDGKSEQEHQGTELGKEMASNQSV